MRILQFLLLIIQKNNTILDEIVFNSMVLFEDFNPASLSTGEMEFFDKEAEKLFKLTFSK